MRLAITGATGFVGRQLVSYLASSGHDVVALVRSAARAEDVLGEEAEIREYDPYDARDVRKAIAGADGIINLAGEGIFNARWTGAVRHALRDSRVVTTRVFAEALRDVPLDQRPKLLVSASAIGIYGARAADVPCREDERDATTFAPPSFLAHICKEWEDAAERCTPLGIRVVCLRIGVVLGPGGGALAQMEPVARKCASVKLGHGKQIVSWIHVEDLIRTIVFALDHDLRGPVNVTAPEPVSNAELAKGLSKALKRPTLLPGMPAIAAKLVFGKGRADILLTGQRVEPFVLNDAGFRFNYPTLTEALTDIYA